MTPAAGAGRRRAVVRGTGWRPVLAAAVVAGALITGLAGALGLLIAGGEAALSALSGGTAVLVLSATSLALIDLGERRVPRLTVPLFLVAFVIKVVALVLLAQQAAAPDWVRPGWAAVTAAVVVVGWQVAEIRAFLGMRVTVDPESD